MVSYVVAIVNAGSDQTVYYKLRLFSETRPVYIKLDALISCDEPSKEDKRLLSRLADDSNRAGSVTGRRG